MLRGWALLGWVLFASACMDHAYASSGPPVRVRSRNRTTNTGNPFPNNAAFQFDGVDESLSAADAAWEESAATHTVCLWIKASSYQSGDGLIGKEAISAFSWLMRVSTNIGNDAKLETCIANLCTNTPCTASNISYTSTGNVLVAGQPLFICSVWDNAQADATKVVQYVNASAVAQVTSGTFSTSVPDCDTPLNVASGTWVNPFGGTMDEITWWSTALSAASVSKLCCGSTGCSSCRYVNQSAQGISGLVGYWRADGSTNPNALDSSGGHTLTANNMEAGDFGPPVP